MPSNKLKKKKQTSKKLKEIYDVIRDKESIICEKQIDLELYLACIENKRILPLDFKLEESGVENGNRLILF